MRWVSWFLPWIILLPAVAAWSGPLDRKSSVGVNLGPLDWFGTEYPFIDFIKNSAYQYQDQAADPGTRDSNGWLTSYPAGNPSGVRIITGEDGDTHLPLGTYEVRWDGSAGVCPGDAYCISFSGNASLISGGIGHATVSVSGGTTTGIFMQMTAINDSNPVRNMIFVPQGGICTDDPFTHVDSLMDCNPPSNYSAYVNDSATIIFRPQFLASLQPFSVLRFMDWIHTNASDADGYSDVLPETYMTYSPSTAQVTADTKYGNIPPFEVMIKLCNILDAHCWFTIPHLVNDSFITSLGAVADPLLEDGLSIYLEYSNEFWNSAFAQRSEINALGAALSPPDGPIDGYQYMVYRTRKMTKALRAIMGDDRVYSILGRQNANTFWTIEALDWGEETYGVGNTSIDALAVAPYAGGYFTAANVSTYLAGGLDYMFGLMDDESGEAGYDTEKLSIPYIDGVSLAANKVVANDYGIELITYEGGFNWLTNNQTKNNDTAVALAVSWHNDSRVYAVTQDHLQASQDAGASLFVWFSHVSPWGNSGSWGLKQFGTDELSYKYEGVVDFINNEENNPSSPPPTTGGKVQGSSLSGISFQ